MKSKLTNVGFIFLCAVILIWSISRFVSFGLTEPTYEIDKYVKTMVDTVFVKEVTHDTVRIKENSKKENNVEETKLAKLEIDHELHEIDHNLYEKEIQRPITTDSLLTVIKNTIDNEETCKFYIKDEQLILSCYYDKDINIRSESLSFTFNRTMKKNETRCLLITMEKQNNVVFKKYYDIGTDCYGSSCYAKFYLTNHSNQESAPDTALTISNKISVDEMDELCVEILDAAMAKAD